LFLHAGAYWIMWGLRISMPKRSMWRVAQFDTLRLRLIKLAARVVEMKTMIRIHLPTSCPAQHILRHALERIPRLVTSATGREQPRTPNPSPSTRKHFLFQTPARRRRGRSLSASKPNRKKSRDGAAECAIILKALHNAG